MRQTIGAILMLLAGCVLLPLCFVFVLLLPRRDVEPWRSIPPPR